MKFDLTESGVHMLAEALHRLREIKVDAHAAVAAEPGYERVALSDFGVSTIDKLLATLNAADEEPAGLEY